VCWLPRAGLVTWLAGCLAPGIIIVIHACEFKKKVIFGCLAEACLHAKSMDLTTSICGYLCVCLLINRTSTPKWT
jgi:hypothetical protein